MRPRHHDDISTQVPVHAPDVAWEEREGRVTLRRSKGGPVRSALLRLFGISPILTVHLDAMGSEVWRLVDGTRSTGTILAELQKRHPDEDQMNLRLGQYVSTLASNRFIRFA